MKGFNDKKNFNIYYLAWLVIAGFFFYQYILRVSPGIMVVELRQTFALTAKQFSSLGSIYLLSYSLLQIPLGFILDYFGVRKIILSSLIICMLGTVLFAFAQNLLMLQTGRFLMGLGSAPAFICALKLVHDHLPAKYSGFLMGVTLSLGTFGALLSGKFIVLMLEKITWSQALLVCAGLGGILLLMVFTVMPRERQAAKIQWEDFWKQMQNGLKMIFRQKEIIIYSVIAISVYTPLCVLADLWGTAFLMEKYSLSRAKAAPLSLYLYAGLTLGSLVLPWFAMKWGVAKQTIQICAAGLILTLLALLYVNTFEIWQLSLLLLTIGLLCGAEMICFAAAAQYSPQSYSGLTLGVVNTLNMLGGGLVQQLIGWYLDFQWKGEFAAGGERYYSAHELTTAFSLLVVMILVCCLLTLKLPKKAEKNSLDPVFDVTT